jgi:hypothetical protein
MNSEPERGLDSPNDDKQTEMNTVEPREATKTEGTMPTPNEVKFATEPEQTSQPTPPPVVNSEVPQAHKSQADAVTLVLQWLTYAFWGWFALAMLWLSAVVYAFLVNGSDSNDWTGVVSYPIASVLVLLVVAAVVDFFYRRREPAKKEGFATAVMVIHTVIFALCGIGALVAAVFAGINLVLSETPSASDGIRVALFTALTMVPIYTLLIARTTLVAKWRRIPMLATIILSVGAAVFIGIGVFGPVARSVTTRQDRQVSSALSSIVYAVNSYDQENDRLPESLDGLDFSTYDNTDTDTIKSLLAKGVITYKPNTKSSTEPSSQDTYSTRTVHYYQLCATFTSAQTSPYTTYSSTNYSESINAQYHKKGEQCYNVKTNSY